MRRTLGGWEAETKEALVPANQRPELVAPGPGRIFPVPLLPALHLVLTGRLPG